MKSASSYEMLEWERDIPTTREDVLALRRAREIRPLTFEQYLAFLASFASPSHAELRARKGPSGPAPFDL